MASSFNLCSMGCKTYLHVHQIVVVVWIAVPKHLRDTDHNDRFSSDVISKRISEFKSKENNKKLNDSGLQFQPLQHLFKGCKTYLHMYIILDQIVVLVWIAVPKHLRDTDHNDHFSSDVISKRISEFKSKENNKKLNDLVLGTDDVHTNPPFYM